MVPERRVVRNSSANTKLVLSQRTYIMAIEPISKSIEPRLTRHPDGITAVDAEYIRSGLAASHIIQENARAAFVDTGANNAVPHLLAALDRLGVKPEAVDYVFLTHVHLDHAGGAGLLLKSLPNAKAVIHPRGAAHLIAPEKLIAASKVVYGEENFRRLYGDIVPIPEERVIVPHDGQRISLAGREFELVFTPGHALHHYAVVDAAHSSVFTGDTFGISYRELDTDQGAFIVPTTTPTQFDPDQLIASIERIESYRPRAAYLMHYSRVTDIPRLAQDLKAQIHEFVRISRSHAGSAQAHREIAADIRRYWLERARRHGCAVSEENFDAVLGKDLELNTQGLVVWLSRVKH